MDAFYASVEQRDNPELRGKPVAVGGSRGARRRSGRELRGARSSACARRCRRSPRKRQCPDLIFVKPRFDVYKAISQQIRAIFAEHTPIIEPLSLDEAYLDVTENLQRHPVWRRDIALAIRARIKTETGLNASAGISYNKFLAKLASDHRKPNGQFVITPEMGPAFVEDAAGRQVPRHRTGDQREDEWPWHLHRPDLATQTLDVPAAHFGKAGAYYYWISRGVDERPVRANRIRKSVGAENNFASDLTEFEPHGC